MTEVKVTSKSELVQERGVMERVGEWKGCMNLASLAV